MEEWAWILSDPMLEVMMMTVCLKSTVRPWESVSLPSARRASSVALPRLQLPEERKGSPELRPTPNTLCQPRKDGAKTPAGLVR